MESDIFTSEYLRLLFSGFLLTIRLSIMTLIASFILGTGIGILGTSSFRTLRIICLCYVEALRNIPILIIIFFFYFGLPKIGILIDGFTCGVVALSIYTASFVAEAIRSGILAIGTGQWQAARALGLGYFRSLRLIILPQAISLVLPPLTNISIGLVKDTALVSTIGVADLMHQGQLIESRSFATFQSFSAVALFYIILIFPMALGAIALEHKNSRIKA